MGDSKSVPGGPLLEPVSLARLGWDDSRRRELDEAGAEGLLPVRVAAAASGLYLVWGLEGRPAQWVSCRKRMAGQGADSRDDVFSLPATGDWALVRCEQDLAVIVRLLSRRSVFVRKAAGPGLRPQLIASNVDRVLIVTACDHDFNLRRLERYLAVVWDGGAEPVVVVNKTDLDHDRERLTAELEPVALGVRVVWCSGAEGKGLEDVFALCDPDKTVAFVGSSGVGKSTLINRLLGTDRQATAPVRTKDGKGRHTTSAQQLFLTSTGAVLVDTPGLRELGLWDASGGVERTFADIEALSEGCRFRDCTHAGEPGCAVAKAVDGGQLAQERLESYRRLQRELAHQGRRVAEGNNSKARFREVSRAVRKYHQLNRDLGLKEK